jgi:hypothetical protein
VKYAKLFGAVMLVGLVGLAGCGLGIHINPTVAVTAPYHDHQNAIKSFPSVRAQAQPISMPGVSVGAFARYYATPYGFWIGKGPGAMRSWGRGHVLTWAAVQPEVPPERVVQAAFATSIGGGAADGELVISGVVTELSWYVNGGTTGGRITTKLVVARRDGTPVFEGEQSTTGRAPDLRVLIAVHVERWLADPKLGAALRTGGSR